MNTILYVVGKVLGENTAEWMLCGIYDDKFQAIRHCSTPKHFYGPVSPNTRLDQIAPWPGCEFPPQNKQG